MSCLPHEPSAISKRSLPVISLCMREEAAVLVHALVYVHFVQLERTGAKHATFVDIIEGASSKSRSIRTRL